MENKKRKMNKILYRRCLKNFKFYFDDKVQDFMKNFVSNYLHLTQQNFFNVPLTNSLSGYVLIAAIVIKYSQLKNFEKSVVHKILNAMEEHLRSRTKYELVNLLLNYCPNDYITPYESAYDILKSQATSDDDVEFLNALEHQPIGPLYKTNDYYVFELPAHFLISGLSTGLCWSQQLCNIERTEFSSRASWCVEPPINYLDNKAKFSFTTNNQQYVVNSVDLILNVNQFSHGNDTNRLFLFEQTKTLIAKAYGRVGPAIFEVDGVLNWFLLNLHNKKQVAKLCRRAAFLSWFLKNADNGIRNGIVSFILLAEHRYSGCFLYYDAPHAFRNIVNMYQLPIVMPLMIPFDQNGFFQIETLTIDTPAVVLVEHNRQLWQTRDREAAVLYFVEIFPMLKSISKPDGIDAVSTHSFESNSTVSCILIQCKTKIMNFRLNSDQGQLINCPGEAAFVKHDHDNYYWFSFSLKQYTDNINAITYRYESSYQVDPPMNFVKLSQLHIQVLWNGIVNLNSVRFYFRTFNVLRQANQITGLVN